MKAGSQGSIIRMVAASLSEQLLYIKKLFWTNFPCFRESWVFSRQGERKGKQPAGPPEAKPEREEAKQARNKCSAGVDSDTRRTWPGKTRETRCPLLPLRRSCCFRSQLHGAVVPAGGIYAPGRVNFWLPCPRSGRVIIYLLIKSTWVKIRIHNYIHG
jgi:hypothetical protein